MYVSLYHYMVYFKIIQNYMSITSQLIFEIKVITHIHTKHLAYTYRYISMHTSMLDRFPYNRVIYTHTSHTHTILACTPHTHTIYNPLRPHRHHTHNQATYRNTLIHICHNQNTHTT